MEALILAGGLGTRLRSVIGESMPKSMAPVAGRPFLEYLIAQLRGSGVDDVILLVGHGASHIQRHFGDGARSGPRIRYSMETTPLGTAGAVRNALPLLRGTTCLLANGDSSVDCSLEPLIESHRRLRDEADAVATLGVVRVEDTSRFGSVVVAPSGEVIDFAEKAAATGPGLVNAGVAMIERRMIEAIPRTTPCSLETEVWPSLVGTGLWTVVLEGSLSDIGVPEAYADFQAQHP